jgi:heme/copper-type cytochrome/quinol oxidase subunit 2
MYNARTLFLVLVAAWFWSSLAPAQEAQEPKEIRKITVVAHRYAFEPSTIELKAGEPVEITFVSQDAKHGFECPDLHLEKIVYEPGKPATVTFTPETPGTYRFKCAHFCGFGHGKMKGEFVVVAP